MQKLFGCFNVQINVCFSCQATEQKTNKTTWWFAVRQLKQLHIVFIIILFPEPVTGLDAYNITHVACGATHSVALNQWGQVFSWGSDTYGQLGHQLGQSIQPVPKIVRALAVHHIVQIACGQRHTVVLANSEY